MGDLESGFHRQEGLLTVKGNDSVVAIDGDNGFLWLPNSIAAAGSDAATAAAAGNNVITFITSVTADSADGVILPASPVPGQVKIIINCTATAYELWPGTGDIINAADANDPFTVAANGIVLAIAQTPGQWRIAELGVAAE